jgi:hypothetical protein
MDGVSKPPFARDWAVEFANRKANVSSSELFRSFTTVLAIGPVSHSGNTQAHGGSHHVSTPACPRPLARSVVARTVMRSEPRCQFAGGVDQRCGESRAFVGYSSTKAQMQNS